MKENIFWNSNFEKLLGTNGTGSNECNPPCNNGVCYAGECSCFDGFFSDLNLKFSNCDLSMKGDSLTVARSLITGVYILLFLIATISLLFVMKQRKRMYKIAFYTKIWSFGTCAMATVFQILHWGIDPYSYLKIIPIELDIFFSVSATPLLYSSYLGILFHWIAFVELAERSLERANMWKKMGRTAEATVEDVMKGINIARRIRIPIMIFLIIFYIIQIAASFLENRYPQFHIIYIVYILQLLTTICIFISFLVFRSRINKLLPEDRKRFIKQESRVVLFVLLANIIPWTIFGVSAAGLGKQKTPQTSLIYSCVGSLIYICDIIFCLWVHARKWPLLRWGHDSSSASSYPETYPETRDSGMLEMGSSERNYERNPSNGPITLP
jgi:hypothetical protein